MITYNVGMYELFRSSELETDREIMPSATGQ